MVTFLPCRIRHAGQITATIRRQHFQGSLGVADIKWHLSENYVRHFLHNAMRR